MRFPEPIAAASLHTTAGDYAKFLAGLLNDPATLRETTGSSMIKVNRWLGLEWGLGWGIERSGEGFHIWQWGNNPGYRAFAMASTSTGKRDRRVNQ